MITSSSSYGLSYEPPAAPDRATLSVFTAAIVDGLLTGDADQDSDGWVDVNELYDYAYTRVRDAVPGQCPQRMLHGEGTLRIAKVPSPGGVTENDGEEPGTEPDEPPPPPPRRRVRFLANALKVSAVVVVGLVILWVTLTDGDRPAASSPTPAPSTSPTLAATTTTASTAPPSSTAAAPTTTTTQLPSTTKSALQPPPVPPAAPPSPPSPTIAISRGQDTSSSSCDKPDCSWVTVVMRGFEPNRTFTVHPISWHEFSEPAIVTTDANGSGSCDASNKDACQRIRYDVPGTTIHVYVDTEAGRITSNDLEWKSR